MRMISAEEKDVKHDKQCGSGNSLFNRLYVGACVVPALGLAFFFRDSLGAWFAVVLMLAVCSGAHSPITRSRGMS